MKTYKPTISEEILLKDGYRKFLQPESETILYQKKVTDKKGIKYFLDCYYTTLPYSTTIQTFWNFNVQMETKDGMVEFQTIQWFNQEGIYTGKNHLHAEEYFEKIWIYSGKPYYEEFGNSKKGVKK